jgi:MFS family permease
VRRLLVPALLLLAGWAAILWLPPFSDDSVNDLYVYRTFAAPVLDGELPYREQFFEYPPLAAPAIVLPGLLGTGEEAFRWAFAGWTFLLAAAVTVLCGALAARTGGDRRRALLAAAAMPFLCGAMLRTHFDLAPVALMLLALWLVVTERPRVGLAVLGLAVMTKGFPLVAAPVVLAWLAARDGRRAALEGGIVLAGTIAVVAGLALAASPDGFRDSISYQVDRPLQVESTPAAVVYALDGLGLGKAEGLGSHRSDGLEHPAGDAVATVLAAALLALVALLSVQVAARPGDRRAVVLASLGAVAAFACLGRVLSPQYLVWTLPLGVLAFSWRLPELAFAVALATVLTQIEFPALYHELVDREALPVMLVCVRDAVLLAAVVLTVRRLQPRGEQQLLGARGGAVPVRLD